MRDVVGLVEEARARDEVVAPFGLDGLSSLLHEVAAHSGVAVAGGTSFSVSLTRNWLTVRALLASGRVALPVCHEVYLPGDGLPLEERAQDGWRRMKEVAVFGVRDVNRPIRDFAELNKIVRETAVPGAVRLEEFLPHTVEVLVIRRSVERAAVVLIDSVPEQDGLAQNVAYVSSCAHDLVSAGSLSLVTIGYEGWERVSVCGLSVALDCLLRQDVKMALERHGLGDSTDVFAALVEDAGVVRDMFSAARAGLHVK